MKKPSTPDKRTRERLWHPTFCAIVTCTIFAYCICQGLNTSTTVYLNLTGNPSVLAGVAGVVFSASAGIMRLATGPIIDSRGRAWFMVFGAFILLAGVAVPLIFPSFEAMLLARALQGFGFSALSTAAATAAVDVLPKTRLDEGISYFGLGQAIAMALGPTMGLVLVTTSQPTDLFWGMLALALISLALASLVRYEKNPSKLAPSATYRRRFEAGKVPYAKPPKYSDDKKESEVESLEDSLKRQPLISRFFEKQALPGAIPSVVLNPVYGFGIFFVGLYGATIQIDYPSLFFAISAAAMILVRLASNSYVHRVTPIELFAVCVSAAFIAFLMLAVSPSFRPLYYAAGLFYGISLGLSMPLLQSVAVRCTPPERWGAANAMSLLAYDIGAGGSSIVWGFLSDSFGYDICFCCIFILLATSFAIAKKMFPKNMALESVK